MSIHVATRRALLKRQAVAAPAGGTSDLYTKLVAFWKLDEASGNRADSVGANTLTDTNTVTSNTGLVYANAAEFLAANNEHLTINDNAALSVGGVNFAIAFWAYKAATGTKVLLAKDYTTAYQIFQSDTNTIHFQTTSSNLPVSADGFTLNAWHFVFASYSTTGHTHSISCDNGALTTATRDSGPTDNAAAFTLGSQNGSLYFTGRIGPVMMWKAYIPTADDITWLYNAGAGRTLAEMAAL